MSSPHTDQQGPGWFPRTSSQHQEEESILPRHVPQGQRRSIDSAHSEVAASPSSYIVRGSSPIQIRNPESDEARERQRTMDVESAMLMGRARSGTVTRSPVFEQDAELADRYPMLSRREEDEMTLARGEYNLDTSAVALDYGVPEETTIPSHVPEVDSSNHLDQLVHEDEKAYVKPPLYSQPSSRDHVDFSAMEEFAKEERVKLGLSAPSHSQGMDEFRRRLQQKHQKHRSVTARPPSQDNTNVESADGNDTRSRQRKLSTSQPKSRIRSGKLALFESTQTPSQASRTIATGPSVSFEPTSPRGPLRQDSNTERPFRFSFYSNALSSTIHSRSVCELPAEGQTYEQLFYGGKDSNSSGTTTQVEELRDSSKSNHSGNRMMMGAPNEEDINTWWLDVLMPTDEEMRMFAKVRRAFDVFICLVTWSIDLLDSPSHYRRYSHGGNTREDRAVSTLLPRLLPRLRPRPIQPHIS